MYFVPKDENTLSIMDSGGAHKYIPGRVSKTCVRYSQSCDSSDSMQATAPSPLLLRNDDDEDVVMEE